MAGENPERRLAERSLDPYLHGVPRVACVQVRVRHAQRDRNQAERRGCTVRQSADSSLQIREVLGGSDIRGRRLGTNLLRLFTRPGDEGNGVKVAVCLQQRVNPVDDGRNNFLLGGGQNLSFIGKNFNFIRLSWSRSPRKSRRDTSGRLSIGSYISPG